MFLISVKGNSILQVKPIKTNQPNKNPGITPNSTLTPHPVYQQILNCLSIFRNLPLVIASAAIILLKATVTSLLDSCRSLLIGLLTSTLVPFIHSHDSSQSDLDKTTDHIIHLSHCHAVLQPHWDPCWSLITVSNPPSQAFVLILLPPDLRMAGSCTSFCSNVAFPGRLFPRTTSSLTPTPTHTPYPLSLLYFSAYFLFILLSVSTSYSIIFTRAGIFVRSAHCCTPKCLEHCWVHSKYPINTGLMSEWMGE